MDEELKTPALVSILAGLDAIMDEVWNAAVEQAATIAKDCVHLTPEPDAAIRVMLNGRSKLHPAQRAVEPVRAELSVGSFEQSEIDKWMVKWADADAEVTRLRGALAEAASDISLGWKPPKDCDGKEQYAFEAWAAGERYDMHEHPLHYLFLDPKTYAARQGWKAALRYVRKQFASAEGSDQ